MLGQERAQNPPLWNAARCERLVVAGLQARQPAKGGLDPLMRQEVSAAVGRD